MAEPTVSQAVFNWNPDRPSASAPRDRFRPVAAVDASCVDAEDRRLRWLTADEATAHLGFPSRKALYAAVERGQVPAHRLGRRLRFRRDELDALLRRRR